MTLFHKILSSYRRLNATFWLMRVSIKRKPPSTKWLRLILGLCASPHMPKLRIRKYTTCANDSSLNSRPIRGTHGFTLVELIVTVTVLGIIASIAIPSILTHLARLESQRVKHQIQNTLSLAKAESYISRQDILVCLSNHGGRCHRNSDETLLLFVDRNNNKHFDHQVDVLLTQQDLNLRYSTLKLRVGGRRHYTKFWGDSGKPRGHFGHIKYCPTSSYNQTTYQISFNQAGHIKQKLNENHPTKCNA